MPARFRKILELNYLIFPFLWATTLAVFFLETYKYRGFLSKHFSIDSTLLFIITYSLGFSVLLYNESNRFNRIYAFLFRGNKFLFPFVTLLFFVTTTVDLIKYPNYIFSTLHLQPQNLIYPVFLSLYLFLLNHFKTEGFDSPLFFKDTFSKVRGSFVGSFIVLLSLGHYTIYNTSEVLKIVLPNTLYIAKNLNADYEKKMRKKWGFFYDYMLFIERHTDEDSTIVLPPQELPWLSIGNGGLVRYFLYPRKLISGDYESLPNDSFDHILVARGSWPIEDEERYGWPKIPVDADKIIYLDHSTNEVEEFYNDYDPIDAKNKGAWGIIKVRKSK